MSGGVELARVTTNVLTRSAVIIVAVHVQYFLAVDGQQTRHNAPKGGVRNLNCMTMTQGQHALLQTRAENDDVVFAVGEGGQTGRREGV
jgi:hypothetical protein